MNKLEIKALARRTMAGGLAASEEAAPGSGPRALVLIGQLGAGQLRASARLQREYFTDGTGRWRRPAVVCEEDFRCLHELAPDLLTKRLYSETKEALKDIRLLERCCVKMLASAGRNILWLPKCINEITAPDMLKIMRRKGYRTETVMLAVPGKLSAARAAYEYERLKGTHGMAFIPVEEWHRDSLRFMRAVGSAIENRCLANRIRVLNDLGGELFSSEIPLPDGGKTSSNGVIRREQTRALRHGEYRCCLKMLSAVADGMDRRFAPHGERRAIANFIESQFADSPEALYISRARIARNASADIPGNRARREKGE
ncbi:MAG: zeta toxin family protein [Synergistaceae bacterium]|jgi:hypothetical protein|nr:zeta toxin family protein [Synergistaceae bacterium]